MVRRDGQPGNAGRNITHADMRTGSQGCVAASFDQDVMNSRSVDGAGAGQRDLGYVPYLIEGITATGCGRHHLTADATIGLAWRLALAAPPVIIATRNVTSISSKQACCWGWRIGRTRVFVSRAM